MPERAGELGPGGRDPGGVIAWASAREGDGTGGAITPSDPLAGVSQVAVAREVDFLVLERSGVPAGECYVAGGVDESRNSGAKAAVRGADGIGDGAAGVMGLPDQDARARSGREFRA